MLQASLAHAFSKRQLQIMNGLLQAACVGLLVAIISSNVFLPLPTVGLPGIWVGPKIVEGGRKRFKGINRPSAAAAVQMSGEDCAAAVLPNPVRWSASRPTTYIQRRAARILRQMRGIPSDEEEDGEPD